MENNNPIEVPVVKKNNSLIIVVAVVVIIIVVLFALIKNSNFYSKIIPAQSDDQTNTELDNAVNSDKSEDIINNIENIKVEDTDTSDFMEVDTEILNF